MTAGPTDLPWKADNCDLRTATIDGARTWKTGSVSMRHPHVFAEYGPFRT
jgi:hypothetical protein